MNFDYRTLFVGDLPNYCHEADLQALFAAFGPVMDVKIHNGQESGRSSSYAFVTLTNFASIEAARKHLDGFVFMGRKLKIRRATLSSKTSSDADPAASHQTAATTTVNSLYIRFTSSVIDRSVTEFDVHRIFAPYGLIEDVSIKESSINHHNKVQYGYGFVHFTPEPDGVRAAFQAVTVLDRTTVQGITLHVELSRNLLRQFNRAPGCMDAFIAYANSGVPGLPAAGVPMPTLPATGMSGQQPPFRHSSYPPALFDMGGAGYGIHSPVAQNAFAHDPSSASHFMADGRYPFGPSASYDPRPQFNYGMQFDSGAAQSAHFNYPNPPMLSAMGHHDHLMAAPAPFLPYYSFDNPNPSGRINLNSDKQQFGRNRMIIPHHGQHSEEQPLHTYRHQQRSLRSGGENGSAVRQQSASSSGGLQLQRTSDWENSNTIAELTQPQTLPTDEDSQSRDVEDGGRRLLHHRAPQEDSSSRSF